MINKYSKKAFSLIELSIVIVITSVLILGIFQGIGMIKNARINNARAFTVKSPVNNIDGLVAWYETSLAKSFATGEIYDTSQITRWLDISPSSENGSIRKNSLTTTASANVIYVNDGINNIPSIQFSGAGNLSLENFYQGNSLQKTIFLVIQPLSTSTQTILDSDSTGNTSSTSITSSTVILNAGSAVGTATGSNSASFSVANNYVMALYFNEDSSRVYINHAINKTGGSDLSSTIGTSELKGLTVGSNKSSGTYFTGLISEIIIFDRPLKTTDRQNIMKYLGEKYKISIEGV
jgi:prepilin-type N-terminal cleavage/methylation domain-containing protein